MQQRDAFARGNLAADDDSGESPPADCFVWSLIRVVHHDLALDTGAA
jgi:hypothetical protein